MSSLGTYRVVIFYREPSYEQRTGPKRQPYQWTYRFVARNAAQARQRALDDFDRMQQESSVGWVREIVEVTVELLSPG